LGGKQWQENVMIIRLAALGALGYAAYKYLEKSAALQADRSTPPAPDIAIAGGPLSNLATVQHSADEPPKAIAPEVASG
jgi:uncharacterized membrane protein YebE (DUF533 family)